MNTSPDSELLQRLLEERYATSTLLHNEVGQILISAVINLELSGNAPVEVDIRDEVARELRAAIAQLRDISLRLSRPPGEDTGA